MIVRRAALVFALSGLLLAGAGLYRWIDEDGRVHYSDVPQKGMQPHMEPPEPPAAAGSSAPAQPAPSALTTLARFTLEQGAVFRLAVGVRVETPGEGDRVEALFENPDDAESPLAGTVMSRPGTPENQYMLVSPPLALACRSYAVTLNLYRAGSARPEASRRERISSKVGCEEGRQ